MARRLRGWCARPALAGALAGLTGGIAFVLLAAALTDPPVHGGDALPAPPPAARLAWAIRLALGTALGAAFGRLLGARLGGAVRAVALGAAFGVVWWLLESLVATPFRPHICVLLGEVHGGTAATTLVGLACSLVYGVVTGASLWGCHALAARALPAARRLEVYVAAHCFSCVEAHRLAAAAASRFPGLEVRTIDLDAARAGAPPVLPDGVVAVPTYLLDGTVVALGNPEPEQLFARIASAPARRGGGGRGAA